MTRQCLTPDSRRCFDTHTKERSSPEIVGIVENVFRKLLRPKIQKAPFVGVIPVEKIQAAVESVKK